MDSALQESTMQMLRPGQCVDLYYPNPETSKKQCFRTNVNTKYQVAFTNLTSGVSQFTFSPNNGLQDIMCVFRFPSNSESAAAGLSIPRGWGYAAINRVSFRVGGSSQFFLTGDQILLHALDAASDAAARDAIFSLGGNLCVKAADFTANNFAYVWLKLPWTTPSAEGKMPPLPTDLLTQQVIVTVELNPISSYCSNNGGTIPSALMSGNFTGQQVVLQNQGDALARRHDMTTSSLSYPVKFVQQETQISYSSVGTGTYSATLSGFRSGEVTKIILWLTIADDNLATLRNPLAFYRPQNVVVTYMGDQYSRYDADSGQLWNLINGKALPEVSNSVVASYTSPAYSANTQASQWVVVPFAQANDSANSATEMYVAGREVTNGIVNVNFTLPSTITSKTGPVILHASYEYNAVYVFGAGTCDLAF